MASTPTVSAERKDLPLGTLIFRAGLLSEEQLQDALEDSIRRGRRLGQVLLERGLLQESDLARLLADQKGLPFVSLAEAPPDAAVKALIRSEVAWLNHAVPVALEDGVLIVAIGDPTGEVVMRNVRAVVGQNARFVVTTGARSRRSSGRARTTSVRCPPRRSRLRGPRRRPPPPRVRWGRRVASSSA